MAGEAAARRPEPRSPRDALVEGSTLLRSSRNPENVRRKLCERPPMKRRAVNLTRGRDRGSRRDDALATRGDGGERETRILVSVGEDLLPAVRGSTGLSVRRP